MAKVILGTSSLSNKTYLRPFEVQHIGDFALDRSRGNDLIKKNNAPLHLLHWGVNLNLITISRQVASLGRQGKGFSGILQTWTLPVVSQLTNSGFDSRKKRDLIPH